jgi:hypothetical protein
MTQNLPAEGDARNSFLWYCDRGSQSHLKLFVCPLPAPLNWREALLREPGWGTTKSEKWHTGATRFFPS